jgi:hypothetical protein
MSPKIKRGVERFERDDHPNRSTSAVRRRGIFKLLAGLGVLILGGGLFAAAVGAGDGPGARMLRTAAGGVLVIGLLGSVFGLAQVVLGAPWKEVPQRRRILFLCCGIPAVLFVILPAIIGVVGLLMSAAAGR